MGVKVIKANGEEIDHTAEFNRSPSSAAILALMGFPPGYQETVRVLDPAAWRTGVRKAAQLIVHESGRLQVPEWPFNQKASDIYWAHAISRGEKRSDLRHTAPVVGDVLLLTNGHMLS